MRVSRFQRNAFRPRSVYACHLCGKRTRETGEGESTIKFCRRCYLRSGLENTHSDSGHPGALADCPECRDYLNDIERGTA